MTLTQNIDEEVFQAVKEQRQEEASELFQINQIPSELKDLKIWTLWKYADNPNGGKKKKHPCTVTGSDAKSNDPNTWNTLDEILGYFTRTKYAGIGFFFTEENSYVGIDYDNCVDPNGNIDPEISEIIGLGNTYTEFSPSKTGIHQIVRGKKPGNACRYGRYEMYEKDRFFTLTGNRVHGTPSEINAEPELIQAVYDKIESAQQKAKKQEITEPVTQEEEFESDEELIAYANKTNKLFKVLFSGNVDPKKYPTSSEADEALFRMISIYTKNIDRIERIARMSVIPRPKWDTHPTYLRDSIQKVLDTPATPTKTEKTKDEIQEMKPYIITDDELYLEVIDKRGNLEFAWLEGNEVKFAEFVEINEETIYPQSLPASLEKSKFMIGIPSKEELDQTIDISADDLFKVITSHIHKYIDAPDSDIELFTYFSLFTWFYKKGNTVPYLRFIGDTGTGKSRFITTIADLCFYPVTAEGGSSGAAMIRINEKWHGTLKVDEADLDGNESSDVIKFLNLGFEANHPFCKVKMNKFDEVDVFDPFCPKLIAMRKPFNDNATEGRCLSFKTRQMTRDEIDINLSKEYLKEVAKLRALIARFAMKNWNNISNDKCINYTHLKIEPRLRQMAYPLSIILQLFPDGYAMFEEYMKKRQVEVVKTRSTSFDGNLFNKLLALATNEERASEDYESYYGEDGYLQAITPTMVSKVFVAKPKTITDTLKGLGFEQEDDHIQVDGKRKTVQKYVVQDEAAWYDVYSRYHIGISDELVGVPECPKVLKGKKFNQPKQE